MDGSMMNGFLLIVQYSTDYRHYPTFLKYRYSKKKYATIFSCVARYSTMNLNDANKNITPEAILILMINLLKLISLSTIETVAFCQFSTRRANKAQLAMKTDSIHLARGINCVVPGNQMDDVPRALIRSDRLKSSTKGCPGEAKAWNSENTPMPANPRTIPSAFHRRFSFLPRNK